MGSAMSSQTIFALRKQGQSTQALQLAREELQAQPGLLDDLWFSRAYGWVLFDAVKQLAQEHASNPLAATRIAAQLSPLTHEFARMAKPLRGDLVFSQVLAQVLKLNKEWPKFLAFAHWAGLHSFSKDDQKPYVCTDGTVVDSLQKRFVRAVCAHTAALAEKQPAEAQDHALLAWGTEVLQQALQNDADDQWLNYYQAKLYLAKNETEQAMMHFLPLLQRQSKMTWVWALMARIFAQHDPAKALVCNAYASQLARKEQEVAKVRIELVQQLVAEQRFNEAAQQLHLALQFRKQHSYKIPAALQQLQASHWYQTALAEQCLQDLPPMKTAAMAILKDLSKQHLSYCLAVVDHVNQDKSLTYVLTGKDQGAVLLHRDFPDAAGLERGSLIELGFAKGIKQPQNWRLVENPAAHALPDFCLSIEGCIVRPADRNFGFINTQGETIFVPDALAATFADKPQQPVRGLAIWQTNKQGKQGWRAIHLEQIAPG